MDPPTTTPPTFESARAEPWQLQAHLRDPLYRTGYFLILGTGIGALLGFVFWGVAAHVYSATTIGLTSAMIAAMMLVSGICSLGMNAVLVRYLPAAGPAARALVLRTYAITATLSMLGGAAAALTSRFWAPSLRFLGQGRGWVFSFALATAAWTVFSLQDSVLTGLRAAHWVPIENSLFSATKLVVVMILATQLPRVGPFVAWNAPVGAAVLAVTPLIFLRLIPRHTKASGHATFDGRQVVRVAFGNYGGTLFSLFALTFMPVLVARTTSATATAYFYIPWMIAISMQLIALNMTTSLTVEAAQGEAQLRQLCRRTFVHTLRLLVPAVLLVGLAAPVVLRLFGRSYANAGVTLLRLLAAGAIPNVLVAVGLAVARIKHKGGAVLAIQAGQCVLLLGISAVLLPRLGINSVGVAWLTSQLVVAAALFASLLRPLLLSDHGVNA